MKDTKFGKRSLSRLYTCDPKLILLILYAESTYDEELTILCGYRSKEEQDKYYNLGTSQLKYPQSKHNFTKNGKPYSKAIDICPYPVDWENIPRFRRFCEHALKCADELGIKITSGGISWGWDYPHFQLEE